MTTLLFTHPSSLRHVTPNGHPERVDRIKAVNQILANPHFNDLARREAPLGRDDDILRAHAYEHLERIRAMAPAEGMEYLDPDTVMSTGSLEAALRAVGAATAGVDAVFTGEADNVFCATRPPGHHAERETAMGFCFFNNVAVAARHALDVHGLKRVAVVDFDVHHGNGTEDIVAGDGRILMCSFFQHPLYPYSGAVPSAGNLLNVPVAPYTRGPAIRDLVQQQWIPRPRRYRTA